jgi:hypothetical protein
MNWLRKIERMVLYYGKLLIVFRIAGRLYKSWE